MADDGKVKRSHNHVFSVGAGAREGGLEPGTEYVTDNSYVIKADIEKSGASHDH